ncbi:universal stress protein [Methylocystis sp.]|uniref:universal stress protein n=1 Tax=Methylocystis sp. TaxID=1911079 RepID=UPI003DA22965
MTTTSRPIVVAFDGSQDATRALHWAVDLAQKRDQPLRVAVVALDPDSVAPGLREYEEDFAASAQAVARDIVKHARLTSSEVEIHHGWILPVLREQCEDADLMVVGSHGHGLLESQWLGSVSQHLAGHAPCAVAVVRKAHHPWSHQVLVGVDGSAASRRALRFACEHAALTGQRVLAAYAYRYPRISTAGLAVLPEDLDVSAIDAAEATAAGFVAEVAAEFPGVELRSTAVIGRPGRVLARLSDDSSLVVVGSRGHTTFEQLLLGSVAQETLHRAECPVVVIR